MTIHELPIGELAIRAVVVEHDALRGKLERAEHENARLCAVGNSAQEKHNRERDALRASNARLRAALEMFLEAQASPAPRDLLTVAAMHASAALAAAKGAV